MKQIRLGIIGIGNMGRGHIDNVASGLCPSVSITAVCDIDEAKLPYAREKLPGVAEYKDAIEMLDSGKIDTVLIAVPHYDHPTYAIEAFKRGIHVMTEKPAGVYTRQVREMNEAADKAGVKFGIMFNQRATPLYVKAHELVKSGALGELKRLVWIVTNWYRTQAYYDSGTWRATWNGEGGGVLLNQAPHNLDLWQWIFGMPKKIHAFCDFGKYHNVAIEDDVTIIGEYENGAVATFITTTGEAPGTNRLEISGDKGKIVIEGGKLKWWKLETPEREFCFTCEKGFATPKTEREEFENESVNGHATMLEAFANAILNGGEMIADGREGLNSLSISNAAYVSAWTGSTVTLPVDEDVFEKHLAELCENESVEKKQSAPEPVEVLRERWKVRW
ncbi:MAG: Gfo/Idh/MocA family oxidoreductase [Clostridia bacterium]|nr:Gfo/Idh/MocA family oxidoreductase [Clostridia bacterium]